MTNRGTAGSAHLLLTLARASAAPEQRLEGVRQLRRGFGRAGIGLAVMGLSSLAWCQTGSAEASWSPQDAARWLGRVQLAAQQRNYVGTLMFSAGGTMTSSKLVHFGDGQQRLERLEPLNGKARVQYRHNGESVTLWPGTKLAVVESRDPAVDFPSLPDASGIKAVESYELRGLGRDRIAGHEADVVLLTPKDGHRYAQRLWAERDTGLLLRGDILGSRGEILESAAFSDLRIEIKSQPDQVLGPMKRLDGYRVVRAPSSRAQLDAEGWVMAKAVPGFQAISCTKRPLEAAADGPQLQVLQSVFSDGLAQVSLFIEPFDVGRHKQPMRTAMGATHTSTTRRADWWVTVVGEVPMATIALFESSLERRR